MILVQLRQHLGAGLNDCECVSFLWFLRDVLWFAHVSCPVRLEFHYEF